MPMIRTALASILLGLFPACAVAQTAPVAALQDAPTPPTRTGPVDTTALAYYASKHDTARVDAELHRLQRLYPDWKPPADPMALTPEPQAQADDKPLWDLFAADKLDQLDTEIAKRKAADPAWAPPPDLEIKLAAKRTRQAVIAASDRKDFPAVLDLVAQHPDLLSADDLDMSWRVAEAYGRTGRADKAMAIDQALLDTRQDPAERLATVQKAMLTLPSGDVDRLLSKGHRLPDGRSEFEPVQMDLVRQRVGQALAQGAGEPVPDDVAKLKTAAAAPNDGQDAALLGWVASKQKNWPEAATWFRTALKAGPDPAKASPDDRKVAQGAVQALAASGATADAEALAYAWRDTDPALALLYINAVETDLTKPQPPVMQEDRLKRFGEVVLAQQSGEGAQALGWYAYNVHQFKPALAWFQKAMAWQPRDTTALGLALSLRQGGDKAAYAAFLQDNVATFPTLADLGGTKRSRRTPPVIQPAASAVTPVASAAPAAATPERVLVPRARMAAAVPADGIGTEADTVVVRPRRQPRPQRAAKPASPCAATTSAASPAAVLQSGWCLMSLDRPQEAALAFAAARDDAGTRTDAAYGQALASLRANRTGDAILAAETVPQTASRRSEIGLAAMAQAAATAFDEGRYKDTLAALNKRRMFEPEPRDLSILRAWSIYHTGDREQAYALFSMLNAQMSTRETRSGMATTDTPNLR